MMKNYKIDDFIKGIGELSKARPDEIKYTSSVQFDEQTITSVTVDGEKKIASIEVLFPNYFPKSEEMLAKFNSIKIILDKHEGFSGKEEGKVGDNFWRLYSNAQCNVSLETSEYKNLKISSFQLKFFFD